ncbi:MAG: tRNA-dihydrouridine synthase family protein [Bacteroidales bacterium]|nr:tRNA-dihydrouridine synthase family protein [Bacteroidales bacterium]
MADQYAQMSAPELYLGPFQGITDVHFRNAFMVYFGGIDKLFTPFFTGIDTDNSKSLRTPEIDPGKNDVARTIPQILSRDAAELIRFAEQCQQKGYEEINWNLGCPFKRVANKKRGSGLLPFPVLIEEILEAYFAAAPARLSIKCRLGYADPNEIHQLIPVFNRFPLSELIVHARTGKQLYKGQVCRPCFEAIIPEVRHRLVYNGDIFTSRGFLSDREQFVGINHFMLGRGLLSDPFLAADLKGINNREMQDRKRHLHAFLIDLFDARRETIKTGPVTMGKVKELWTYLIWSFDKPQAVWRRIREIKTEQEYKQALTSIFAEFDWTGQGYAKYLLSKTEASTNDVN